MKFSRHLLLLPFIALWALPGVLSAQSDTGDTGAPPPPKPAAPVPAPAKTVTVSFAIISYADGSASYQGATGPVTVSLNGKSFDFKYPYVGPPDLVISRGQEFDPNNAVHVTLSNDPRVKSTILLFAPGPGGKFQVTAVPIDFSPGKVKIVNMCPQGAAFKWGTNPPVELKQDEMKVYTPPTTGTGTATALAESDFGDWTLQENMGANLSAASRNYVFLMNGDYFPAMSRRLIQMFIMSDGLPPPPAPAPARGPGAGGQ